jgi:hypothetical protein
VQWRAGCAQSYTGEKKRVVIVGAGFGGLAIAKALEPSNLDITVIAPVDYFNITWGALRSVVRACSWACGHRVPAFAGFVQLRLWQTDEPLANQHTLPLKDCLKASTQHIKARVDAVVENNKLRLSDGREVPCAHS